MAISDRPCPSCGTPNAADYRFCIGCHRPLDSQAATYGAPQSPPPPLVFPSTYGAPPPGPGGVAGYGSVPPYGQPGYQPGPYGPQPWQQHHHSRGALVAVIVIIIVVVVLVIILAVVPLSTASVPFSITCNGSASSTFTPPGNAQVTVNWDVTGGSYSITFEIYSGAYLYGLAPLYTLTGTSGSYHYAANGGSYFFECSSDYSEGASGLVTYNSPLL